MDNTSDATKNSATATLTNKTLTNPVISTIVNTGGVAVQGTNTNDDAAAGYAGEYISSTILIGSAVALTTGTPKTVTSISLTAGDWVVSSTVGLAGVGSPTTTNVAVLPNLVTDALPSGSLFATYGMQQWIGSYTGANPPYLSTREARFSLSSTTTIYMIAYAEFTGGTSLSAIGYLQARRVR